MLDCYNTHRKWLSVPVTVPVILGYYLCKSLFLLVRQQGLEPRTYCLEGSCSVLLSYWRTFFDTGKIQFFINYVKYIVLLMIMNLWIIVTDITVLMLSIR